MTTIGKLTFPDERAADLTAFANRVEDLVGDKIAEPVEIVVKPREQMPEYVPGKFARGYWRDGKRRRILLSEDLFGADDQLLEKTLGHEVVHTLFSDSIGNARLQQLLPLMTPAPETFRDDFIDDNKVGYEASPEECCCVWGSAAIFGFDPPAYANVYKRSINKADLAALRQILLSDGQPGPGPGPGPQPPPVDACQPFMDENAVLKARLKQISNDLDTLRATLEVTAERAKGKP